MDEVAAALLRAGDVVRLDDPQAHRVDRVVLVDGRVVVELRLVGLDVPDAIRVTLPADGWSSVSAGPAIESPFEGLRRSEILRIATPGFGQVILREPAV